MEDRIGRTSRLWWALGLGVLLSLAGAARAQEQAAATEGLTQATSEPEGSAPPSTATTPASDPASSGTEAQTFLIESLDVEGPRRDSVRRVVLSESRLVAGAQYTEREIAQAARRVKRLPFILDARPSLRRGSAPGRYTLVFITEEHSPLTLGVLGDHWADGRENMSTGKVSPSLTRFLGPLTQLRLSVDTGARRRRLFEGPGPTLASDDTPLSTNVVLGLTRHEIAGAASRLDVSFSAGRDLCTVKDFLTENPLCNVGSGWGFSSSLLIPSKRNGSVTLFAGFQTYRTTESVGLIVGAGGSPVRLLSPEEEYEVTTRRVRFGALWTHDTTDDPVAALEGTQIVTGLSIWLNSEDYKDYPYQERPFLEDWDGGILVLRFQHLLRLSREFSVSAVAAPLGGLVSGEGDTYGEASLGLRWVRAGRRNRYRLSLESGLIGVAGGTHDARHWMPYSSLRFRSGLVVVALDARWAR